MSVAGEMSRTSPSLSQTKTFDTDYMMPSQNTTSPKDTSARQDQPSLRRINSHQSSGSTNNNNTFMGQQFGLQHGAMDYPDTQTMDFLQNLGAAPNGEFGGSGEQVDLGFGMNWDGLPNEYGDNQQMNPFDTFFFGGQQGGGGPGGMGL
jgi:hypothetical protein